MNTEGLARLAKLAEMKKDMDIQALRRISERMNALQKDIDQLREQSRARIRNVSLDTARMSGVDVAWQRWADATITRHLAKMAELAVTRETCLTAARASFGRAYALNKLRD